MPWLGGREVRGWGGRLKGRNAEQFREEKYGWRQKGSRGQGQGCEFRYGAESGGGGIIKKSSCGWRELGPLHTPS